MSLCNAFMAMYIRNENRLDMKPPGRSEGEILGKYRNRHIIKQHRWDREKGITKLQVGEQPD